MVRTSDVHSKEQVWVANPRFHEGRQVEDAVHVVHRAAESIGLRHVPDDRFEIGMFGEPLPFRWQDESPHLPSVVEEHPEDAASNEPSATGHERLESHLGY